jgi:hypothetical protein
MLRKPTTAQVWLRLPNAIFNNLTLLQPIYFQSKRYYLNKLEQYNNEKLCRAELVEIKNAKVTPLSSGYFVSAPGDFLGYWGTAYPSVTQEYLVFNNSETEQTIDITLAGGTGTGEWSIDKTQVILDSETGEVVTLSFNGSVTLGNRTVDLTFTNQDTLITIRPAVVDVVEVPLYSVTPNPMAYGSVGTPTNLSTIIENTGNLDVEIDLTAITGTDASQFTFITPTPGGPFTLIPGATQEVRIRFIPNGTTGPKTAECTAESSTPGAVNTLVNITATEI